MGTRNCQVTVRDLDSVTHTAEVMAANLYEAVALGLRAIRESEWAGELPSGLNEISVSVAGVRVEHKVQMKSFQEWLGRTGGRPKDISQCKCVREVLKRWDCDRILRRWSVKRRNFLPRRRCYEEILGATKGH